MRTFLDKAKDVLTIRWRPGTDTAVAFATAVIMVGVYASNTYVNNAWFSVIVFTFFGNGLLNVLFPAYYTLRVRGEPLSELGITTHLWSFALIISLSFTLFSIGSLRDAATAHPNVDLLPNLFFNGLILWEPFFVYGWLQLRYERAFGILPGIVLAGLSFSAYHLGTFPPNMVVALFIVGMIFAVLFRVTRNLLALWPLTWAVSSSIGTITGGFAFSWIQVGIYAALLVTQIAVIAWLAWQKGRKSGD